MNSEARRLTLLRDLECSTVATSSAGRPLYRADCREALQQVFSEIMEFAARDGLRFAPKSTKLYEKVLLRLQICSKPVAEALGDEPELDKRLVPLPASGANEDRHEQGEEQQDRQADRDCTAAPECAWFTGADHDQRHE